jgi:hypothetical protein
MKKSKIQKKMDSKINEQKWLSFFQQKFIMVAYPDLILVPNQALLLGYIRGMITANKNRTNMKRLGLIWMKDPMKKMAFLTGVSESTIKDYISILLKKQYISRGNLSTEQDNTNWYTINQEKIDDDFKLYLSNQNEDLKTLEKEQEIELKLTESNEVMVETSQVNSQKSPIETAEDTRTLLYNNIESSYKSIESNKINLEEKDLLKPLNINEEYFKIKDIEDIEIHLSILKKFNIDEISKQVKLLFLTKFLQQDLKSIKSNDDVKKIYYRFNAKLKFTFNLNKDEVEFCLRLFDLYIEQSIIPQPAELIDEVISSTVAHSSQIL